MLITEVNDSPAFVTFDESLNKKLQKGQMDVTVGILEHPKKYCRNALQKLITLTVNSSVVYVLIKFY